MTETEMLNIAQNLLKSNLRVVISGYLVKALIFTGIILLSNFFWKHQIGDFL